MKERLVTVQPVENVGRGALFTLMVIPLSIIVFGIAGGVLGLVTGFAAIVVPFAAAGLYAKGARAPLTRAGWAPYLGITVVALILGSIVGLISGSYYTFNQVSGDGGITGNAFWTTVRNQLTTNIEASAFPIILGLGLGAAGIYGVIKRSRALSFLAGSTGATTVTPQTTTVMPPTPTTNASARANRPSTAPSTPPVANRPSPGVILNGKPIEPDKK